MRLVTLLLLLVLLLVLLLLLLVVVVVVLVVLVQRGEIVVTSYPVLLPILTLNNVQNGNRDWV